ncbi:MAG: hypothetical protein CSA96_02880 [Bacteroidetes bacterium]|nr:MAG: hypothetical protein CSA96_02880 [Bacteroidota bacterium]
MKRATLVFTLVLVVFQLKAQIIEHFSVDTALFRTELIAFTGTFLEESEEPDFQAFLRLYDSLPYDHRMEIVETSNLMLAKKCRPHPHFIHYQRVLIEFFSKNKRAHGYTEWLEGYQHFLNSDAALLRTINQWLLLSLNLLRENVFYASNATTWKVATPSYEFRFEGRMTVVFDKVTLACYSGRDFIQIKAASGYIDPLSLEWYGKGGVVTWERAGMPESEMYATLDNYTIHLKKNSYVADSVELHYPALFKGMVLGRLEDKVTLIKDLATIKYPQFTSYKNSYRIDDFVPGVNYRGGLSIQGASLIGSGVGGEPAEIQVFSNDTLRVRAYTFRATMNNRFIRAASSEVSLYFEEDSIYHPDLMFSYNVGREQLRLNKSEKFTSLGPYADSYHAIDLNFDELFWNRNEKQIRFQSMEGSNIGRATFESQSYFDYQYFMDLQGMDFSHPLVQLFSYGNMLKGTSFNVEEYAKYIGFTPYQVRHSLMKLNKFGFVYFNDETDMVTLRQKLYAYIEAATRKRDYDVIRFVSRTEGEANAELNLETKDLAIRGIPSIFLSDSQNVRLIPENNEILMKRNRSFQFDGIVDAGLVRFTGQNFFFNYDSFLINLQDVDSMQMSITTGEYNQYGEPILARIDNAIEGMTGELLIDDPNNKSGLENHPQYPTFTSRGNSYIYFDKPYIQNGVYERDEFYFELDPFVIDSLDNFRPEAIAPNGTFVSAGILPPLELSMSLRDDRSLGFIMQTEEEGLPVYGGMGTFYNDIEMSSAGLHGYGSFDFISSTTWSDDFLMHPDSMSARSRRFLVREKLDATEFPYVENTVAGIVLRPSEDKLDIHRIEETFRIFGDSIHHAGDFELRATGLSGQGLTALPEARLESRNFSYLARAILADSAGVKLKTREQEEPPFLTDDVSIYVDLNKREGSFTAKGDNTLVELPDNLYETHLNRMNWLMDSSKVELSQSGPLPQNLVDIGIDSVRTNAPYYNSRHPRQDGLRFAAPKAIYDYRDKQLHALDVPVIEVADAYVFPHNGKVEVGLKAEMKRLEKARVVASTTNRQYLIYDASIGVNGAKSYEGSGYYDYADAFGNSYQTYFSRIWVDTTLVTHATGYVPEDDPFMLSPWFDFKGELVMKASSPLLTFDGGAKLVHDCEIGKAWLRFTSELDPADIRIPVGEKMQNTDLNKVFAGTMITRDSTHIYSTFVSGRKDYFDATFASARGELVYDEDRTLYIISEPDKRADSTLPGSYLQLNTDLCELYSEGPIDLTLDYGQVKLKAAGNALHQLEKDRFTTRLLLGMDFPFSAEALAIMGHEIDSLPDLEPVDLTSLHYQLGMRDLLGAATAGKLERELALNGAYKEIPDSWKNSLFFNDIRLKWNQDSRSFRYNGKVGIGNIGDVQVNKKVEAYIEFVEKGSGDVFDIYLRIDPNTWYYFAYSPGGLQVLSSNRDFNNLINDLKAKDRRSKTKGERPYIYSLSAQRRLDLFVNRFLEYEDEEGEEGEVF